MKALVPTLLLICSILIADVQAQRKLQSPQFQRDRTAKIKSPEIGKTAVVIDETLSVLRAEPSLFAKAVQRMRRGRAIQILDVTEADGVKFFKVYAKPKNYGWVQADAVFGRFRSGDEERLARLVQALDGFDQIEAAVEFFKLYPTSKLKPAILLLFGDALEEVAVKLSRDASNRLSRKEMAASGAPLHSYYLNFVSLDRYRKLGVLFLFNPTTRQFHYQGASWMEILTKYPDTNEAVEARKRIEALKIKMEAAASR